MRYYTAISGRGTLPTKNAKLAFWFGEGGGGGWGCRCLRYHLCEQQENVNLLVSAFWLLVFIVNAYFLFENNLFHCYKTLNEIYYCCIYFCQLHSKCPSNKKNITRKLKDIDFVFSWQDCSCYSNINPYLLATV